MSSNQAEGKKIDWPDAPWYWFLPDPKFNAARATEVLSRVRCPECDSKGKANG